ncbi:methyl-accepting chemotaxis protein [Pontivivens ytuae]|uniref:Methyl-accepting transducer domain-containing protein n=1 Tax=Pontivivens ytuae TaxID=2789856 RepID=A0A7S9QDS0_9RHOB|nr:methyl-accepting chemotaxis protein [Pontivivens ytuae]QPH54441.1 hypothetical protein I0K15_01265 [Pontivivens ytuae]
MSKIPSIRRLGHLTYVTVGPARIAACVILLAQRAAMDPDVATPPQAAAQRALDRLDAAVRLLQGGLAAEQRAVDVTPGADVAPARSAARQALEELQGHAGRDADALASRLRRAPDLTQLCLVTLEERITDYLSKVEDDVARIERELLRQERTDLTRSLRQLENVGRSIELIAINAGVEAARAGTAGAGLRVIAGEMQRLSHGMGSFLDDMGRRIRDL